MRFTKPQIIFLAVASVIGIVILLVLFGVLPGRREIPGPKTELVVWGTADARAFQSAIRGFESTYQDVDVTYKSVDEDGYETTLVNAMAAGTGPDVLMFDNDWLRIHGNKIVPMPSEKMTLPTFDGLFPVVAKENLTGAERIFALPLSIDTLVMVYNRDLLDQAGVVFPPTTWEEFGAATSKLTVFDDKGEMTRAGAALGSSSANIPNAADILTAIFMQKDVSMTNENTGTAQFSSSKGREAFNYYLDFARESKHQSWDDELGDAVEAFAKGNLAILFGYPHQTSQITSKNPFAGAMISALPQENMNNAVNVADYWALAVSRAANDPGLAWDFVIFAATDSKAASDYATVTNRTPALRFLIEDLLDNPNKGVSARQALTARGWANPGDANVSQVFDKAIEAAISGELSASAALSRAASEITSLLR